jgi:hypothetical protein
MSWGLICTESEEDDAAEIPKESPSTMVYKYGCPFVDATYIPPVFFPPDENYLHEPNSSVLSGMTAITFVWFILEVQ